MKTTMLIDGLDTFNRAHAFVCGKDNWVLAGADQYSREYHCASCGAVDIRDPVTGDAILTKLFID